MDNFSPKYYLLKRVLVDENFPLDYNSGWVIKNWLIHRQLIINKANKGNQEIEKF